MINYQLLTSLKAKTKHLYQLKSQKIIEISQKEKERKNDKASKKKESNLNQKIVSLMMIDCEDEIIIDKEANLRVISDLNGYSQINYNDSLYLCGSNNESTCSFLLHIDLNTTNDIDILINSQYPHIYPSLAVIEGNSLGPINQAQNGEQPQNKRMCILVVGGLKQIGCESYDVSSSKWTKMPELPEERYRCALIPNQPNTHVFLFGGFNTESGTNANTILRLNISAPLVWERILIKENAGLICLNSCACIYNKNDRTFILIGGVNNANETSESLIQFDPLKRRASQLNSKLYFKAKFKNQSGYEISPNKYSLIDSRGSLHKINLLDINISNQNI